MLRVFSLIFVLFILMSSCRKEVELISGTITGRVTVYDQSHRQVPDRSGINVTLLSDNGVVATKNTDSEGGYAFDDIPYGRYRIFLRKDEYIQAWDPPFFDHVGGYSPTYANQDIFEIPVYELTLDSVGFDEDYRKLLIHLKVNGDTVIVRSAYGYPFIAYISDKQDVSKDNHIVFAKGSVRDEAGYYPYVKVAAFGRLTFDPFPYDRDIPPGTVYMKIYPLAHGQGYNVNQFYREALGNPSNTISFDWYKVTGAK